MDIARQRLQNQHLTDPSFLSAEEVVRWLGAVQAQDFAGAKWAVALRTTGLTDAQVNTAFADGSILRTHLLRPTWHLVPAADIRWMLALTAPRVHALNAYYYRQTGLDEETLSRAQLILAGALQGHKYRTRNELAAILGEAGIPVDQTPLRTAYILMYAELEGLICSGPLHGKQFTYALLDERVPQARSMERDEALAELTRRYFQSHGPATLKDFTWWSGLSMADVAAGMEMVKSHFLREEIGDRSYYFAPRASAAGGQPPAALLLSIHDEYIISYADRSAITVRPEAAHVRVEEFLRSTLMLVLDSQIMGTWRRDQRKKAVHVEVSPFAPLSPIERAGVDDAVAHFGRFLQLPVTLTLR